MELEVGKIFSDVDVARKAIESYNKEHFTSPTVPLNNKLFGGTVPPTVPLNNKLFGGTVHLTVPPNNKLFRGTVPPNSHILF